jgi:uncharacterized protein
VSLKQFDIELSKLRQGKNQYVYRLDTAFFGNFDNQSIRKADIEAAVEIDKTDLLITLLFDVQGTIDLDCEKCLAVYPQPVSCKASLLVKITDEELPPGEDDEIIYLSRKEHSFNIGQALYDYIVLALPFVKVCEDPGKRSECDSEMLERLNRMKANASNHQGGDDRWDKLKDILSNN